MRQKRRGERKGLELRGCVGGVGGGGEEGGGFRRGDDRGQDGITSA